MSENKLLRAISPQHPTLVPHVRRADVVKARHQGLVLEVIGENVTGLALTRKGLVERAKS